MLYCERCMTLAPDGRCPYKAKHLLRDVQDCDPVYLMSKNSVWAGLVENVFRDNSIEYLTKGQLGAGLIATVGEVLEVYDFYVRYCDLDRARDIVEGLFSEFDVEVNAADAE